MYSPAEAAQCPHCGAPFDTPGDQSVAQEPKRRASSGFLKQCPECGEYNDPGSNACEFCGGSMDADQTQPEPRSPAPKPPRRGLSKIHWLGILILLPVAFFLLKNILTASHTEESIAPSQKVVSVPTTEKFTDYFNIEEVAYLGKTVEEIKGMFPDSEIKDYGEKPFDWRKGKGRKVVQLQIDKYMMVGICREGGCNGYCYKRCLTINFNKGKCVMIIKQNHIYINQHGGAPWGSFPLGQYIKKSLADIKPIQQSWQNSSINSFADGSIEFELGDYAVSFIITGNAARKNAIGLRGFNVMKYYVAKKASLTKHP